MLWLKNISNYMKENSNNKKKIMFLITGSEIGGAEIVVKNIIFNLDYEKFLPIFVSIRPLGKIGEEIGRRCKAVSLDVNKKFNLLFLWKLYKIIKHEEIDILHCHLFHANLIGRIIGKISGVPFIISTIHTDNFGSDLRYFLLKITDFLGDKTIVVSQKIKDELIKRKIVAPDKIKVIYNGVAENKKIVTEDELNKKKEYLKIEKNYPIILSVGRLNKIKGHIYLIKALNILKIKYPNLRLLLIGDGPEKKILENKIGQLGLSKNILFLGEIRDLDIYYQLSDIFVLPSINEGFGLSVVEAMSNKLLAIATRVGGVPEIIEEGISGYMANPEDENSIAHVIDRILNLNEEEKKVIINNAYLNFKSKFSLEKMISNYESLYLS